MADRDTDVTRIIADAVDDFAAWPPDLCQRLADEIIVRLHEAGYVIAKVPETTKSPTGGLS